jgi:hypothetical protein
MGGRDLNAAINGQEGAAQCLLGAQAALSARLQQLVAPDVKTCAGLFAHQHFFTSY